MSEHDRLLGAANRSDDEEDDSVDVPLIPSVSVVSVQRRLILIEVPVFLYFTAFVTNFPVVQFYLYDWFSKQYGISNSRNETNPCSNSSGANHSEAEAHVQSKTNQYMMYMSFISNFVAIIPTLFLGILTDKFGRKFVFFISSFGLLASQMLIIAVFHWKLSPDLLFLSSLCQGLSGSFGLFLAAVFGMVADFTAPGKERAFRVTTTEAVLAVSSSVGTSTSGIWVKQMGYIWPMVFALCLVVISLVFVIFFIPETLLVRQHQSFSCQSFLKGFELFVKDTPDKRRFKLLVCIACFLIVLGCYIGESNFSMLYLLHQPFCWDKMKITIFNGVLVMIKWVTVLTFIQLTKRWISEPVFAMLGTISVAAGYLLKGLAWSDHLIYVSAGVSVLSELVSPMTRTMMSKAVSANEQGALFAGIGVLQMVISSVAGIALSSLYNVGLTVFLGLPYLVITGILCINVILLVILIIRIRFNPQLGLYANVEEQVVN